MKRFVIGALTITATAVGLASANEAFAWRAKEARDVPHCDAPLGTVAIDEPENKWWYRYELGNPEALIKTMVARSGCFKVVDRGRALQMRGTERALADSGELQSRSNVGKGQIKSADFYIIPDIVGSDSNSGGAGGAIGGLLGRKTGGLFGGLKTKKLTAHTLLTVVNARTSEQVLTSEGKAKTTDVRFGAGGVIGVVGAVGGGYEDTEIGQVITSAYIEAYHDLVARMRDVDVGDTDAPQKAYTMIVDSFMYKGPSRDDELRKLRANTVVYPTGNRDGIFFEVEDDFGIVGWVSVEDITS